jgi:sulfite exporter TauE/SafE
MLDLLSLITALSLGALGSLHCVMMCGGISCALSSKRAGKQHEKQTGKLSTRLSPLLIYNLGRISSYAMIGFLFGWGSQAVIEQWQSLGVILRLIAGGLLIAMGLYIAGLSRLLVKIEAIGYQCWQRLMPNSLRAINTESIKGIWLMGIVWGWLPCGLVYSTLLWAGALGYGGLQSGMLMAVFGLGTLPAMLATGFFADKLAAFVQAKAVRWTAGFSIIVYGLWTVLSATSIDHGSHHNAHGSARFSINAAPHVIAYSAPNTFPFIARHIALYIATDIYSCIAVQESPFIELNQDYKTV